MTEYRYHRERHHEDGHHEEGHHEDRHHKYSHHGENHRPENRYDHNGQGNRANRINASRVKQMKKLLMNAVSSKNYEPMREKDLAYLLGVPKAAGRSLNRAVTELLDEGKIEKDAGGRLSRRSARSADHVQYGRRDADRMGEELNIAPSDLRGVVLQYGIPESFPDKVVREADSMPDHLTDGDYAGRLDLRGKTVITIDGDDSKDFDDAVSLERSGSGYLLGVHIADVSHYVADGSALDREALTRGTSVYLPDRVLPMLPPKLSNGICSLNEGEDRLTLSVLATLDHEGHVVKSRIAETVICSAHRMTYSNVDRIFRGDTELSEKYADIVPMLFDMKHVAEEMEAFRRGRGMIDFSFPETKFELDENARPVRISPAYPTPATKLIEQFMLTANEIVAEKYFERQLPFVYRNHEKPDSDKIESTLTVLHQAGIPVEKKAYHITPLEVQKIISAAEGTPEENLVSSMLLRAMSQARYGTENGGHFGLASKCYCHFTSPIRRYPDLQIHRIIKDDLNGRLTARKIGYYRRILDDVAWKSSALERRSVEAEREADKVKMAEYVSSHLGEVTEGVITGVTGWGFYVQRPDTVEGLVPASSLRDDFYEYEEQNMTLTGRRHGRTFRMGQEVYVKTVRADVARRMIDFELVEPEERNG